MKIRFTGYIEEMDVTVEPPVVSGGGITLRQGENEIYFPTMELALEVIKALQDAVDGAA